MASLLHASPLGCPVSQNPLFRDFDEAMKDIAEKAGTLDDSDPIEEEAYLLWVIGRLLMVNEIRSPNPDLFENHPHARGVRVCRQRLGPVEFCHLHFDPDSVIPFHDHPDSNAVMMVVEGDVTTVNYDLLDQNLNGLLLQPSVQTWMTAGRMASLSRYRDNVHKVQAGSQGARVLDVFTLFDPHSQCRYIKMNHKDLHSGLTCASLIHQDMKNGYFDYL